MEGITLPEARQALLEYRLSSYSLKVTRAGLYRLVFNRRFENQRVLVEAMSRHAYQFRNPADAVKMAYVVGFPVLWLLDPVTLRCSISCADRGWSCPCPCRESALLGTPEVYVAPVLERG